MPATDGYSIWLPPHSLIVERTDGDARYRAMNLLQASRIRRGGAQVLRTHADFSPLLRAVYVLYEALSAESDLAAQVPGIESCLRALRAHAAAQHPALKQFPPVRRALERFTLHLLRYSREQLPAGLSYATNAYESLELAARSLARLVPNAQAEHALGTAPLWQDWWTGELLAIDTVGDTFAASRRAARTGTQRAFRAVTAAPRGDT